jgi:glycosyltransferase involved in cell wall biosynthesis
MNIMQVFNSRIEKHGSFEDFMIEFAKQAKEKKLKVSFVFPAIETYSVKEKLEFFNAKVYIVENGWQSLRFIKDLCKIIFKERVKVIDFHFCTTLNLVPLFILLRVLRKVIIFHYHGEIIPIDDLKFRNRHFSRLRLITLFVNKIICVSYANKRFLEALNIKKEMHVVYNGIDIDKFAKMQTDRDFKREMGFKNGELIVTSIGSLIPRKGVKVLIKAVKYVIQRLPQARFIIAGGGNKGPYQKLTKILELQDKIIFTGLIKEYPYYILKASDLYVSASFAESFGLSIAEAKALGIPVVATRVGGVSEVVDEYKTGLLKDVGNFKELSEGIINLFNDKELRRQFSEAGKKRIKSAFNLKDKVTELLCHFN